ncbi:HNH endonuclease signature motif containing protein [Actinomadura sp. 6K520]|uniref:HNH endonuclease signature motif containing protein n=1 Tax=Actinomadura sp. 6K520 TaxID=2530364 RepID=UPI0010453964|nr:HNH endonuclease signature motif containing protein [Actinomadura sp. 6K520]TDE27871.1 HNH endonuclease [Actinomadura sp. 6K520]
MSAQLDVFEGVEIVGGVREWEDREWFPPGPQLAICLSGGKEHLADLNDDELLQVAAAARRQTSWAQARELAAIAELARRRDDAGEPDYRTLSARESVTEEIAAALTVTGNTAATLVHLAERLIGPLASTGDALEAGRIDMAKARVICDTTENLPDQVTQRVEAAALEKASAQTTGQLRRRIRRIVQRLAPEAMEERRREATRQRRLELWDTPSGTADLALCDLAAEDAHGIYNKITAAAHGLKADGDTRPLHLIRADLATNLLNGAPLPEAIAAVIARATDPEPGPSACAHHPDSGDCPPEPTATAHTPSVASQAAPLASDRAPAVGRLVAAHLPELPIHSAAAQGHEVAAASETTHYSASPRNVTAVEPPLAPISLRTHGRIIHARDRVPPHEHLAVVPQPPHPSYADTAAVQLPPAIDSHPPPRAHGRLAAAARHLPEQADRASADHQTAECAGGVEPEGAAPVVSIGATAGSEARSVDDSSGPGVAGVVAMLERRLGHLRERTAGAELPGAVDLAVRQITRRLAPQRDALCQGDAERHGRPGYRPSASLRREIEERHATCVFPTCNRASHRCDLDHTVPWRPGITCRCNLAPLCRRHHRLKQSPGWSLHHVWPGVLVWTTPAGAWYIVRPDRQ